MTQYCRYCAHALDYNGDGTDYMCEADAPCGNHGAGKFYCAQYKPRPARAEGEKIEQVRFGE